MQSLFFFKHYKVFFFTVGILQLLSVFAVLILFKCNLLPLIISNGPCATCFLLLGSGLASLVLPFVIAFLALSKDNLGKIKKSLSSIWAFSFTVLLLITLIMVTLSKDRIERVDKSSYSLDNDTLYLEVLVDQLVDENLSFQIAGMKVLKDSTGLFYNGVTIHKQSSSDNKLHIEKKTISRGVNKQDALAANRSAINHYIIQDNRLKLDKFIMIPSENEYKYQKVEYTLSIPDGVTIIES